MSKHIGFPKDRNAYIVTVKKVDVKQDDFGPFAEHTMLTSDGDVLFWKASGHAHWLQEGQTYKVKLTIKTHDVDDNGVPRTVVTRVEQNMEPERMPRVACGIKRH